MRILLENDDTAAAVLNQHYRDIARCFEALGHDLVSAPPCEFAFERYRARHLPRMLRRALDGALQVNVVPFEGSEADGRAWSHDETEREWRVLRRVPAIVTLSATMERYLVEHGVDPGRVLTFPLPVDTARIQLHDIDYASATIGFASGFTRYQNLETAVTHYPDIALAWEIAGSGPEFDAVSSACLTRLDGGVRLLGPLAPPELSRRRCHWSAFYMPPPRHWNMPPFLDFHGNPLKVVEAALAGHVLILPRCGVFAEYYTHGESALLYDPSSDVAETLRLFEGMRAADRQVMGQAARDLALGIHDGQRILSELLMRLSHRGEGAGHPPL